MAGSVLNIVESVGRWVQKRWLNEAHESLLFSILSLTKSKLL
jgi:uncharacterized membrane protein (DUF2068 family)